MYPRLDSPKAYEASLDALIKKWSSRGRLEALEYRGVSLADLQGHVSTLARVLAKTIRNGEFRFSALSMSSVNLDGKVRILYRPNLVDAVVLTAAAKYLTAVAEPSLSNALHSFRKGRSSTALVRLVARYFRNHRMRVPLRERGLYVLRRDIAKYGECIDATPTSPIFEQVERVLLNDADAAHRVLARRLIVAAITQPVLYHDGAQNPLARGVPTGSPIQIPCLNLYLADLDRRFDAVAGAFYARFGDDILFIHPDPHVCEWAALELERQMGSFNLEFNAEKCHTLFVNGAGRANPAWPRFKAASCIEYLGIRVHFGGGQGLKRLPLKALQSQLRRRFTSIRDTAGTDDPVILAQLMCDAVAKSIDPLHPLSLPAAERLRRIVDDRSQLRDFDYRIALMVAEAATGRRGPRAFRRLSYRRLRRMGLPSLVVLRHRKPSTASSHETD